MALPRNATGAHLQSAASVRAHSAPVLPWSGATFSTIQQVPVVQVTAPHHRVRRRALKSDSIRMEPVVLEIANLRDLANPAHLFPAFETSGRSPPSL